MAARAAAQEAVHLRRIMLGLGYEQSKETVIYEDNQGCIALGNKPVDSQRSKHIVREKIEGRETELVPIGTEDYG